MIELKNTYKFINNKTGVEYETSPNLIFDATNDSEGRFSVVYARDGKIYHREVSEFFTKFHFATRDDVVNQTTTDEQLVEETMPPPTKPCRHAHIIPDDPGSVNLSCQICGYKFPKSTVECYHISAAKNYIAYFDKIKDRYMVKAICVDCGTVLHEYQTRDEVFPVSETPTAAEVIVDDVARKNMRS